MSDATLDLIKQRLLETDPQDVATIELLKAKYAEVRKGVEGTQSRAVAPSGAAGAADRGGSTGSIGDLPSPRTAASVFATAPAKGMAGMIDMAGAGGHALAETVSGKKFPSLLPHLVPYVDRLTDELAGKPVENSVGRSAFEGAVTAPLTGGKTAADFVAGGVGGGVADAMNRGGAHPLASALVAMGAGMGSGKLAQVAQDPAGALAGGRVRRASEGLTAADWKAAQLAAQQAHGEGVQLLPSQALQTPAAGMEALQAELLKSHSRKADGLRAGVGQQQRQVDGLIEALRTKSGQQPRGDDMLAKGVQDIVTADIAAGPKAVNAATKDLYNDPLGKAWKMSPGIAARVDAGFKAAIRTNRGSAAIMAALKEAQAHLKQALGSGQVTPELLASAIQSVKNDMPAFSAYPKSSNHARQVVAQTIAPLEDLVAKHAPDLASAPRVQAELRALLPTPFSEEFRQMRLSTGTEGALNAATKRPEVLGATAQQNPQLAQELVQRQLNQEIAGVSVNRSNRLPSPSKGVDLENALKAKGVTQNLDYLFPGNPAAAADFTAKLTVAANASKPRGNLSGVGEQVTPLAAQEIATKGARGLTGQLDYVLGGLTRALAASGRRVSDAAVISILQRPDVIDRLAALSNQPTPRLTKAAFVAAVPQLFEDEQK